MPQAIVPRQVPSIPVLHSADITFSVLEPDATYRHSAQPPTVTTGATTPARTTRTLGVAACPISSPATLTAHQVFAAPAPAMGTSANAFANLGDRSRVPSPAKMANLSKDEEPRRSTSIVEDISRNEAPRISTLDDTAAPSLP